MHDLIRRVQQHRKPSPEQLNLNNLEQLLLVYLDRILFPVIVGSAQPHTRTQSLLHKDIENLPTHPDDGHLLRRTFLESLSSYDGLEQ